MVTERVRRAPSRACLLLSLLFMMLELVLPRPREMLLPGSWHLLSAQRSAANGARTIAQAREMEAGSSWVGVASARCPPVHPLSHTAVHATRKLQQPESTLQQPDKLAFWAYKGGKADGMPLDACSHLAH